MLESIEPTDNPLAKKRKYTCGNAKAKAIEQALARI